MLKKMARRVPALNDHYLRSCTQTSAGRDARAASAIAGLIRPVGALALCGSMRRSSWRSAPLMFASAPIACIGTPGRRADAIAVESEHCSTAQSLL